jgi:hypothetical protein
MKCDSIRTTANLKLFCHTATGMAQEASVGSVYGTMDWHQVVIEMDVPKDTYAVWAWMMYTAPTPGAVWFDDAELQVLGPATGEPTPVQEPFYETPKVQNGATPDSKPASTPKPAAAPKRKS